MGVGETALTEPGEGNSLPRQRGAGLAENSRTSRLQAIVEPLLALVFASAVTLVLTLPFLPTVSQAEVPLRPAVDGAIDLDELVERVEELQLADRVEIVLKDGRSHLVLEGIESVDEVDAQLSPVLDTAGYLERDVVERRVFSLERVLDLDPRVLPALMSIQAIVFFITGWSLARLRVPQSPVHRVSPPQALLFGVGGGVVALLASAAIGGLLRLLGLPVEEQEWLTELFTNPVALAWLAPWIVLFGPIAEEVFFRRYAFRAIRRALGMPGGILVSSALFAMVHFNPSGFLVYMSIGVVLAWVYERTGRLLAPVVGHVTVNAVVLLVATVTPTSI
jgi:membrane protease YdiL (CAAX protease family)